MRRGSLVQSIGCHTYGGMVHEVFCFSLDAVFVFGKTLKKFCSFKLGKVRTFDRGFVLVGNNRFALRLGSISSSSSKSLYFEFCSPGCDNIILAAPLVAVMLCMREFSTASHYSAWLYIKS